MSGKTELTIDAGLDIQRMHDNALAASEAFLDFANRLAEEYEVCEHPDPDQEEKEVGDGSTLTLCAGCNRVLKRRPRVDG